VVSDKALKAARSQNELPAWTQDPATERQVGYLTSLVRSREVPEATLLIIKALTEAGLKKGDAGRLISELKSLPLKPMQDDRNIDRPTLNDVPPGRYAVQTGPDENDISFFRVKERKYQKRGHGRKAKSWKTLFRIAGPNEYILNGEQLQATVKLIVRFGIGDAAALYGHKVGRCSICHTRITNRLSRELGIGPVCIRRVYGDWEERVNTARQSLRARGLDPDERVDA
jgi:hypothetical protein